MRSRHRATAAASLLLAVALTAVAGCSGDDTATAPSPSPSPTVVPTPSTKPTPKPTPTSRLSGRPGTDGPALVLKIDNSRYSLPHIGLNDADVVYIQQVEGGQSRIAAVYSSRLPKTVAPIRSARETDAELLPQYGGVAFGFSGSVNSVHRLVRSAGLIDVSADKGPAGYQRLRDRRAPYNLAATPTTLLKRAGKPPVAKDVGFRFGAVPAGGTAAKKVTVKYPTTSVAFKYDGGVWRYSLEGRADGSGKTAPAASTILIQSVKVTMLNRGDVTGTRVPFSSTVGKGKGWALRDGKSYPITWERPSKAAPTRWLYQGKDFPMKAGQPWVVLLDAKRSPTIS